MPEAKTQPKLAPNFSGIAAELARARNRAGLTHSELHRLTTISRTVLIGYEAGRTRPGAKEIRMLCDALKITPNQLLYGSENPFKPEDDPLKVLNLDADASVVVRLTVLFQMLTRDERASVANLMHSILSARHGKQKLDEAIDVVSELQNFVPEILQSIGGDFEKLSHPETIRKLEAATKKRFARFEKKPPKNK